MSKDCSNPEHDYYPRVTVCYSTMAQAAAQRQWHALHETADGEAQWHDGTFRSWANEYSRTHPFHRDDGLTITVADTDDGSWDRLVRPEQSPGEKDEPDEAQPDR